MLIIFHLSTSNMSNVFDLTSFKSRELFILFHYSLQFSFVFSLLPKNHYVNFSVLIKFSQKTSVFTLS